MKREMWEDEKSKDLFIPSNDSNGNGKDFKLDYVYGPGRMGFGYYHLLTIDSYKALYARLRNEAPTVCCCFGTKAAREEASEWDDVLTIVYNRSIASRPDDVIGAQDAIRIARGEAISHYHYQQNAQFVVGQALIFSGA
mmetsp:Transcript_1834/g.2271  ORF Transcript_1834/g.2271 Transcript_1834/m.2271 type:complete len:139 (+) Transcript_1834:1-417(+)